MKRLLKFKVNAVRELREYTTTIVEVDVETFETRESVLAKLDEVMQSIDNIDELEWEFAEAEPLRITGFEECEECEEILEAWEEVEDEED